MTGFLRAVFKASLLLAVFFASSPHQHQPPLKESVNPIEAFEHDENLQSQADALLALFDNMPRVPVFIKDAPVFKNGTNTERGAAYTDCDRQQFPTVYVKKIFYQKANQKQLVNALKHELTHAWLCRQGLMSVGHGDLFRRKFTEVGGFGN